MSKLTSNEAFDLFSAIDLGWANPVLKAGFRHETHEINFYRLGDEVYYIYYTFSNTVSECYKVEGENLELFNIYYKMEDAA